MRRTRRNHRRDRVSAVPSVGDVIALPWRTAPTSTDPASACTIFAARLPLRSRRALAAALLHAARIRYDLRAAPGLVGHTVAVDLASTTFWTVSAWDGRTALARFERSAAHRAAKYALRERLMPSTFAVWDHPVRALPIRWAEIRERFPPAAGTGS